MKEGLVFNVDYALTFIEGVLAFISPCILPMLPVYMAYLAGAGEMESGGRNNRLFYNSAGFVIGFTIVFLLLGATVTALGQFLSQHRELLRKTAGIIMVLFGLHFAGVLKLGFMNVGKRLEYDFGKLKFPGSILFGMVFGFSWTPCLSAFLGSALALAGSSETVGRGVFLLLLFSLGLGIPFIIAGILYDRLRTAFGLLKKYGGAISIGSGLLLILAGILVFTDSLKYLSF